MTETSDHNDEVTEPSDDQDKELAINSVFEFSILFLAWISAFVSRLFAVIRYESIIHEFDPWFNYRATSYLVKHGFYNFINWFDERAWYPLGRIVGETVYPGLMITAGSIHWVLHLLNISVNIRNICVFLAPAFSGLTAVSTYLLTNELWNKGAGLFAACFIAIVPGYTNRSVAGSYDNEAVAIFAMQFTYYLWLKSIKTGSIFWSSMTALSYFYMVSAWGGYVFIINLIPLHVFTLMLIGRFSHRIFISYSIFYILGLLLSTQIPFVGFQPVRASEHMAAFGIFMLVMAVGALRYAANLMPGFNWRKVILYCGSISVGLIFIVAVVLTYYTGIIAPWSGRFYSLWDTKYASEYIPIIASVSEHQPTTWFSFFLDLHFLFSMFPVGLWYCIKYINDERTFVVLYALSAVYFAGVMVRLMLTFTPVVCILSGIAISALLDKLLEEDITRLRNLILENFEGGHEYPENNYQASSVKKKHKGKKSRNPKPENLDPLQLYRNDIGKCVRFAIILTFMWFFILFVVHCTWVTSNAYSSPSVVLQFRNEDGSRQIVDDFREAYVWLSQNTPEDARIMSWWDYGYQITGMANRTTIVDNNTWNNSHIALVGKAMASNESAAYEIMTTLDVDYVLVIFGGAIGYSGDDINKFLWMVRISGSEHPKDINEHDYFSSQGGFRIDSEGAPALLNSLMYKLCYYKFNIYGEDQMPSGYDRTRHTVAGNRDFELTFLDEAYTTEHWLVRIFRVKKQVEFNRPKLNKPKLPNRKTSNPFAFLF